jgi:hypothetical protein
MPGGLHCYRRLHKSEVWDIHKLNQESIIRLREKVQCSTIPVVRYRLSITCTVVHEIRAVQINIENPVRVSASPQFLPCKFHELGVLEDLEGPESRS